MRRTIETAFYTFKGHPNFKKIKFVVQPLCREKSTIAADVCEFNSAAMIRSEYKEMFDEAGVELDLSLIDEACKDLPAQ